MYVVRWSAKVRVKLERNSRRGECINETYSICASVLLMRSMPDRNTTDDTPESLMNPRRESTKSCLRD